MIRFSELGVGAEDAPDLRLSKQNAVVFCLLVVAGTIATGAMVAVAAAWDAVICAAVASALYLLNIALFARHRSLRGFLNGFTVLSVLATVGLRITMRALPLAEFVLMGGLTWVAGAALTGRWTRVLRVALIFLGVVVVTETLVAVVLPMPAASVPAGFHHVMFNTATLIMTVWVAWLIFPLARGRRTLADALAKEHQRSENLLLNVLPASIAARLKDAPGTIAERFDSATVLFADIVGFTTMSAKLTPEALVSMLDEIFSEFDGLAKRYGLEKIKTIGDAYMAAAGIPVPRPDHVEAVASMALDMREALKRWPELQLRIGIHTGAVVAGVIGRQKFAYDLWGDTVNTASRMESHGIPGAIQVSEAVKLALGDRFLFQSRGEVDVKGKGPMPLWLLTGRATAAKVA